MNDRRTFIKAAGGTIIAQAAGAQVAASDRIRVAVLGVNGRGMDHIQNFQALAETEVAVLCDPDRKLVAERAAQFEQKYNRKVETEVDLRKVFERKDIDVISIATPNHWHALATIWACQAGKDVYVEKPGAHNLYEGRKMVEAAHKYKRIVQHGVQLRSSEALQEAVQLLRKGVIGKVYMARGLVYRWRPSIGKKPNATAPDYLDYDLWTGPAQMRPYS
ncbi:MAG: Gfo/Idh/MocA family oxidoreductase, partial [Pyrinomonadaceae bacterium]